MNKYEQLQKKMKHCLINNMFRTYIEDKQCKSMLSFLRHCPHSPTARRVDERRCYTGRAAIDRILLPAGPTAANLLQWVCCCGPILGQTTVAVVR